MLDQAANQEAVNEYIQELSKAAIGVDPDMAAELARTSAATLVTSISADQRNAVRRLTQRAFTEGWQTDDLAARIKQKVGLTPKQVIAVENFRNGLIKNKVPLGKARTLANDYAKRLRIQRSELIAQTELAQITADAKRLMWQQWKDDGTIDQYAVRVWHTAADESMCPYCKPMNGQRAAIGKNYSRGRSGPPLHPRCRCTESLEKGPTVISKTEPRDADSDGWIDDGLPTERPAPLKRFDADGQWQEMYRGIEVEVTVPTDKAQRLVDGKASVSDISSLLRRNDIGNNWWMSEDGTTVKDAMNWAVDRDFDDWEIDHDSETQTGGIKIAIVGRGPKGYRQYTDGGLPTDMTAGEDDIPWSGIVPIERFEYSVDNGAKWVSVNANGEIGFPIYSKSGVVWKENMLSKEFKYRELVK